MSPMPSGTFGRPPMVVWRPVFIHFLLRFAFARLGADVNRKKASTQYAAAVERGFFCAPKLPFSAKSYPGVTPLLFGHHDKKEGLS